MAEYFARFGGASLAAQTGLAPTFVAFINGGGSNVTPPSITEPGSKGLYYFTYNATNAIAFVLDGATTNLTPNDRYIPGVLYAMDNMGASFTVMGGSLAVMGGSLIAMGSTLSGMGSTLFGIGATVGGMGATLSGMGSTLFGVGATIGGMGNTLGGVGVSLAAMGVSVTAQGTTLAAIGATVSSIGLGLGSTASSFGSTSADPVDLFGLLKRAQEFWEGNQTYTKATGVLDFYSRGSSTLLREKTVSDDSTSTTKT